MPASLQAAVIIDSMDDCEVQQVVAILEAGGCCVISYTEALRFGADLALFGKSWPTVQDQLTDLTNLRVRSELLFQLNAQSSSSSEVMCAAVRAGQGE